MPEVLTPTPTLVVTETASTSSNDSPKSTKSRKLIKFSPRLRKKSRSRENAVREMEGCSRDHSDHIPNGLNDKEKQDLLQVFEMFDKNKDGKISCEELGVVLRTLGHRYSTAEVEEMIKNADKNENGYVEYDEFLLMMKRWASATQQQPAEPDEDEGAREAFRIFDMDGNGYIDRHELRFIMSRLGECPGEEDICEMFRLADLNGDGLIDYEEFTKLMSQLERGAVGNAAAASPATSTSSKASSSKGVKKK